MGDLGTTKAFYSARPRIKIADLDEPTLAEGLTALSITESTDGLFACEATFGNWGSAAGDVDFLYFDRQLLDFGRKLTVEIGEGGTAASAFEGKITGIEGRFPQDRPPEVLVLAEDRLQDLRMVRRTRAFESASDSDVMQQIASHHGLQADIDIDGPTYDVLAQVNQSDLAFLRERARAVDAEIWIENNTLHAQARTRRNSGDVELTYGQGLHEFAVVADVAGQRTSLSVSGWDVGAKDGIEHEFDSSGLSAELDGGEAGGEVLQQAFGERKERMVHLVPLSSEEAQALADAHYRRLSRRFITGRGVAEGDGRMKVGTHLSLRGLGPLFDGGYYLSEVRHTFDPAAGLRTHFKVERSGLGGS